MHKMPFFAKLFWGLRLGLAVPILPVLPARSFGPARRFGLVLRGLLGIAVLAASFAPQLSSFSFVSSAQAQAATPPNSGGQIYNNVPLSGYASYIGSYSEGSAPANGGNVTIHQDVSGVVIIGYSLSGNASNNSVVINGGSVGLIVFSGISDSCSGNVSNNSVVINGGNVGISVYGGMINSGSGSSNNNSVLISGGSVGGNVYGGHSDSGNTTHNSVLVSGGSVGGNVYGGSSDFGDATHNSVTLLGKPLFNTSGTNNTIIYGGYSYTPSTTGDLRTGNTLNVFTSGIKADNIANFQHHNFLLQADSNVKLDLLNTSGTDLGGNLAPAGTFAMPYAASGAVLPINRSITLLQSAGTLTNVPALKDGQALQGASLLYNYSLAQSGNSIVATVNSVEANPQGKALSEGQAAGLAALSMGGDLVAGAGIGNAMAATNMGGNANNEGNMAPAAGSDQAGQNYGLVPFMAVSASSMRYNTGSHVDVSGAAFMLGLAKKWEGQSANLLLGAFAETSIANTKTHNSFKNMDNVDGTGDNNSVGGGILARMDFTQTALKGLYTEASLRMGQLNTHYNSDDVQDFMGNNASYDTNSLYYGAHAGLGYILSLSQKASLDLYGKYFWAHQQGETVTILGDKFKFDDANSHRTRVGGRFSYALYDELAPYAGAAWEYEFDGKARATTYGFDVPAPSLKGSTGVGELGISFTPNVLSQNAFAVDLGVQGYTGMRQGISGSVQLKFEF